MSYRREIRKPKLNVSKNFKIPEAILAKDSNIDYPIFCFRHLSKDYGLDACDKETKSALISQLAILSQSSWEDLKLSGRHGQGSEKIEFSSIKAPKPSWLSDDVSFLLAFRFMGNAPFLAHRNGAVCHILFLDPCYDLYNH